MTKIERNTLTKHITKMTKEYNVQWEELKLQVNDYGYQSDYPMQYEFIYPIKILIQKLSLEEKQLLIDERKRQAIGIQFDSNEDCLRIYEGYVMEEILRRATKATYYM